MEPVEISPIGVFASSFLVAAFAGLAALLRSGNKLSFVPILSALLNSGLLGLGISLLWYVKFHDNLFLLIGICVLAGLGGMTTVDFVLRAMRRGSLVLKMDQDGDIEFNKPPKTRKKKGIDDEP